jgi:hypothetical protein
MQNNVDENTESSTAKTYNEREFCYVQQLFHYKTLATVAEKLAYK